LGKPKIKRYYVILTDEQIEQLTKVETEFLLEEKSKEIEAIERKYENALLKLKKKYKTIAIDVDEPKEKVFIELPDETLTQYFNEGKTIQEICALSNRTQRLEQNWQDWDLN